jgi:hypothetical protein
MRCPRGAAAAGNNGRVLAADMSKSALIAPDAKLPESRLATAGLIRMLGRQSVQGARRTGSKPPPIAIPESGLLTVADEHVASTKCPHAGTHAGRGTCCRHRRILNLATHLALLLGAILKIACTESARAMPASFRRSSNSKVQ